MKRLLSALALAFWFILPLMGGLTLPSALGAVATTKVTLNATTWTDLGVGPLMLNSGGTSVVYAISDTTPTLVAQGFSLPSNVNQVVNTASHVWAMAATPYPAYVYTSPIVGASGGSGGSGAITAGTTATSGFSAGQFLMSDGSKVQSNDLFLSTTNPTYGPSVKIGAFNWYEGSNTFGPALVFTTDNTNGSGAWFGEALLPAGLSMGQNSYIGWSPNGYAGVAPTVQLGYTQGVNYRMYLVNAGNLSVAFDVYNLGDINNGEKGTIDWVTTPNVLTVGAVATGTGTLRPMNLVGSNLQINGVAAVSCAAGTVTLATLVVTKGIVTHC